MTYILFFISFLLLLLFAIYLPSAISIFCYEPLLLLFVIYWLAFYSVQSQFIHFFIYICENIAYSDIITFLFMIKLIIPISFPPLFITHLFPSIHPIPILFNIISFTLHSSINYSFPSQSLCSHNRHQQVLYRRVILYYLCLTVLDLPLLVLYLVLNLRDLVVNRQQ